MIDNNNFRKIEHNKLRERAYMMACKRGWHLGVRPNEHELMMIITEMSEAIQADRYNKHALKTTFLKHIEYSSNYEKLSYTMKSKLYLDYFGLLIKDTFEDELADILIRCYDYLGLRNFDIDSWCEKHELFKDLDTLVLAYTRLPVTEFMYILISNICYSKAAGDNCNIGVCLVIWLVYQYADEHKIDISWYIKHKMTYNEIRPYKPHCKY